MQERVGPAPADTGTEPRPEPEATKLRTKVRPHSTTESAKEGNTAASDGIPRLADMPDLLTVDELSAVLRQNVKAIRAMVNAGVLPRVPNCKRILVPRGAVTGVIWQWEHPNVTWPLP